MNELHEASAGGVIREPDSRPRYKLTLGYDGTDFHGWQKQTTPHGEVLRTVAGVVEGALMRLLAQPITLVGASRTDAGVHAKGQVAHFNALTPIPIERLPHAINSRLPDDVEVFTAELVDARFDAISGARRKRYRYRIYPDRLYRPLFERRVVWHCWTEIEAQRMNEAAALLIGRHDFEGFAAVSHGRSTTIRTIFDCHVEQQGPEVQIVVEGDGFLYNMVRIIAGTLVEIGRGRLKSDVIEQVLKSCDRRQAGPTLPPQGLCLEWIRYDDAESEETAGSAP